MRAKMNKKGMTPAMINWIFVIIAGGIIMIFFFKIISVHSALAQNEVTNDLISDINSVLVTKSTTSQSASELDLPKKQIQLECNNVCNENRGCEESYIKAKGSTYKIETPVQPILSPTEFRTSKAYMFTRGWNIPFQAANFLYIAPRGLKISFPDSCNGYCEEVYSMIPKKLKDAKIVGKDLDNPDKEVEFSTPCLGAEICVRSGRKDISFGYTPEGTTRPYYGKALVLGAIFTENSETYSCNFNKAKYQFENVLKIMKDKNEKLNQSSVGNCRSLYNDMDNILDNYQNSNLEDLQSAENQIKTKNIQLRRNSCPSIY